MDYSMTQKASSITVDVNQLRDFFNKQIDELKKKLNETKDYNIFDKIQDLTDIFSDACMLMKRANDEAENAVEKAAMKEAESTKFKMTQAEFEKELQDKAEAEEAEKKANKIKADPKVLGSYVEANRVKDCGKYFDLNNKPIAEDEAVPIPLIELKLDWMANEMPAIKKEFGSDVFVKLRLILQRVFSYDVENIFWKDTKIVKHKIQRNEVGDCDIVSYIQVGFSYIITDADNNYTKATKKLLLEKKWFTLFTIDDLHEMPEFSDGSVD